VRPGRKIGHVNLVGASAADVESLRERATTVAATIRDGRRPAKSATATSEENT
jgi:5-(carboxyamino)imidazole ribonucleotide synthase